MPKFDKPDSPNIIWGVNALEADLTRPSDSKIQTGWIQEKPPYEFENYSMNKLYQGFAYYNQLGFPEWDSVTEYQAGKSYVQGSNNRVYKCIQTHSNRNPATSGNESWWDAFEGNRRATDAEEANWSSKTVVSTPGGIAEAFNANSDKSTNGYQELPGGLVLQWGKSSSSNSSGVASVTYPQPFPNATLLVIPVEETSGSTSFNEQNVASVGVLTGSITTSGVNFGVVTTSTGVARQGETITYLAIGY